MDFMGNVLAFGEKMDRPFVPTHSIAHGRIPNSALWPTMTDPQSNFPGY
jgi:hypothetical protein